MPKLCPQGDGDNFAGADNIVRKFCRNHISLSLSKPLNPFYKLLFSSLLLFPPPLSYPPFPLTSFSSPPPCFHIPQTLGRGTTISKVWQYLSPTFSSGLGRYNVKIHCTTGRPHIIQNGRSICI